MPSAALGAVDRGKQLALFLLIFGYFSAWSVLRPPFQSADEFAHVLKAQSTATYPWITDKREIRLEAGLANPLAFAPAMHRLPFHPEEKLSLGDVQELRQLGWPLEQEHRDYVFSRKETAPKNPALYYTGVFFLGQTITAYARLAPYEAFYSYRLAGAFLAALAWFWVYRRLDPFGAARGRVFAFLVLIPVVASMGSSVNPDGLMVPLSTVTALLMFRALQAGKGWWEAALALTLSVFVKISGLVLLFIVPLLGGAFLLAGCFPRPLFRRRVVPLLFSTGVPAAIFYFGYYHRLQRLPRIMPSDANPLSIVAPESIIEFPSKIGAHLMSILERMPDFVMGFWGDLGWSDYRLPWTLIVILGLLLSANGLAFLRDWPRCPNRLALSWFLAFGFFFWMATFGIELRMLDKAGPFIHGRYLLPGAVGLAFVVTHDFRRWIHFLLGFMVVLNVYAIVLGYDRYYDEPMLAWFRALPFVGPSSGEG